MSNENLNKKNETGELTVERLKKFEGFEHLSDEEASEVIANYDRFLELTFTSFQRRINKKIRL